MQAILTTILLRAIVPLILLAIGFLAAKYLKPWVSGNDERFARAQEIALIADRITDEMRLLAPDAHWSEWIDEAVDRLIRACGLKDADEMKALAHREIASQIMRKNLAGIAK
ncbi:MAG TPA: hypothetical protein ENN07_04720 [candidate division Zixibacteria bacterium]|nr:hypothetical protein [candidate division Zixibacteria bacterium]